MSIAPLLESPVSPVFPIARLFDLQAYSYGERSAVLPELTAAFAHAGGWVLERRTTSAAAVEFRVELQLRAIVELYGVLVAAGIELTSASHATLTGLCLCRRHRTAGISLGQVVTLRLEISFLDDVTLHSLLMTGSGLA